MLTESNLTYLKLCAIVLSQDAHQ